MGSLPFLVPAFFIAGAACALGPIIIHLLNRRRYREVQWAAMDFLREAVQRNRRIMEIRDIVLLILRTAAIVLIGAAIAQPFIPAGSNVAWQGVLLLGVGAGLCAIVAAALWSDQWIRLGAAAAAVLLASLAGFIVYFQSTQPSSEQQLAESSQPVHAILAIDNSLSMGYQSHEGTLLDLAKSRAKELVNRLPLGSRVSVLPVCGSSRGYSLDPYRTATDANQAIDAIPLVDRSADFRAAVTLAEKAAEAAPDLGKRIILFGDQQIANWRGAMRPEDLADVPPMQIVSIAADSPENSWIADFRLEDGLADTETEAKLIVELRHAGEHPRTDVQVKISQLGRDEDEGEELATQTVTLQPSAGDEAAGTRQIVFNHTFSTVQPEPGRPAYVSLRVSISGDQLPADDERYLVVPVVAALPVVFVDQYSDEDEARDKSLHGETFALRRLLAPRTQRGETPRHLVRIHHVKLEQLDRSVLEDARLVVVAGIADPAGSVPLLREYVQQGGQLVIAAGGQFAPEKWQEAAWLEGAGILPAPLAGELLGKLPEDSPDMLQPFQLSFASLQNQHLFKLAGIADNELTDLYAEPYFFKVAQPVVDQEAFDKSVISEARRLVGIAVAAEKFARLSKSDAKSPVAEKDRAEREEAQRLHAELNPSWLLWKGQTRERKQFTRSVEEIALAESIENAAPLDSATVEREKQNWANESGEINVVGEQVALDVLERKVRRWLYLKKAAREVQPLILARFDNEPQTPYLVQRQIGAGRVLFVGSGLSSTWCTVTRTNAMLIFDRVLRGMIESTLPQRTHEGLDQLTIPLAAFDPGVVYSLYRPIPPEERNLTKVAAGSAAGAEKGTPGPARDAELLDAGFIGPEQRGLTLHHLLARGIYRVVGQRPDASADAMTDAPVLDLQLAINGPAEESQLAALTRQQFDERTEGSKLRWVGPDETISLEGTSQREQNLWWYAALGVLLVLLVELGILAWPSGDAPMDGRGMDARVMDAMVVDATVMDAAVVDATVVHATVVKG